MSYVPDLPHDVRRFVGSLPLELQEALLDRLDEIAAERGPSTPFGQELVSDFVHAIGATKHYVFIVFRRDEFVEVVHVRSIGHVVRTA